MSNNVETVPGEPPQPLRLFVLSHPRTASNLFCKLFERHPELGNIYYPFLFPYLGGPEAQGIFEPEDKSEEIKRDGAKLREALKNSTYQVVLDKLERDVLAAEKAGKLPMIKEHCCYMMQGEIVKDSIETPRIVPPVPKMEDNLLDIPEDMREQMGPIPYHDLNVSAYNYSVLPDRFLKTTAPIFIIRHPAKQVASYYRASKALSSIHTSEFEVAVSFKFSRMLFDFFKDHYSKERADSLNGNDGLDGSHKPKWPIVVDGDDLINDTKGVAERLCNLIKIAPSGLIYEWEQEKAVDAFREVFKGTLNKSVGVVKNESPKAPSIAEEAKKWEESWGVEIARKLVHFAENAMPDYEYLHQYRI